MSVEALAQNIIQCYQAVEQRDQKLIDEKIKQTVEQYKLLDSDSQRVEEIYKKEGLNAITAADLSGNLKGRVYSFVNEIIKTIHSKMPALELEKRIRQEKFKDVCIQYLSTKDRESRMKILAVLQHQLKEGPINVNEIFVQAEKISFPFKPSYLPPILFQSSPRGTTLLTLVMYRMSNDWDDHLVHLFLENGAKVDMRDLNQVESVMNYIMPYKGSFTAGTKTYQLFVKAGFDPSVNLPKSETLQYDHNYSSFLWRAIDRGAEEIDMLQDAVFHGAGEKSDRVLFKMLPCNESLFSPKLVIKEAILLRDQMLEKMQRGIPAAERKPLKDLSLAERRELAKLCYEAKAFRDALQSDSWSGERKNFPEKIKIHNQFKQACLAGDFIQAERLLAHDIDIDALMVSNEQIRNVPLLNYACMLGNVKLAEFLLKHGASTNIGHILLEVEHSPPEWLPPLFECALNNIPNKSEILALLIKAGANPNEQFDDYWFNHLICRFKDENVFEGIECLVHPGLEVFEYLILAGLNVNIGSESPLGSILNYALEVYPPDHLVEKMAPIKMLILLGASINEIGLKRMHLQKELAPLVQAKQFYDQAIIELLNGHLKEEASLKNLSMDLVNMISGYTGELDLTPVQRLAIAKRYLETEKTKSPKDKG